MIEILAGALLGLGALLKGKELIEKGEEANRKASGEPGSTLGNLWRGLESEMTGNKNTMDIWSKRAESMSDDELLHRFKNASGPQKWGFAAELKKRRGYVDSDD